MAPILYKWFFPVFLLISSSFTTHPLYVSVTEIEHNATDRTLEISCKIYTDDFEKTLREAYHVHVDLLKPTESEAMKKLVSDYIMKHLRIVANGKPQQLVFKGFEQVDEAIYSYFQVDNISKLQTITVTDNLLYEYKDQQMSLIHFKVNGDRKSTKMINPQDKVTMDF